MAIQVFVADEQSDRPVEPERWGSLAERVLSDRGVAGSAELNVLFVDEETIAGLNERFLGNKEPTDVLSFPIEDDIVFPTAARRRKREVAGSGRAEGDPEGGEVPLLLGDVVICPEVAWRNAPEHAGDYEPELALLLVHGILHLLGMDHAAEKEAVEMEALERGLLERHYAPGAGAMP